MLSSALECSVAVLHAMGRDEAAAVLAGALLAGVASGMPRPLTGGLVGRPRRRRRARRGARRARRGRVPDALGRGAELSLDETVAYVFSVLDVAALAVP